MALSLGVVLETRIFFSADFDPLPNCPPRGFFFKVFRASRGTAVAQWLRHFTSRKVADSIPAGVIGIFL